MEFIWRYLEDYKLKSLIRDGSLYLPSAFSGFNDLYDMVEGYLTIIEKSSIEKQLSSSAIGLYKFLKKQKRRTYISCWCKTQSEDIRMWKNYVGEKRNGVVIKTSKQKLKDEVLNYYQNQSCYFKDVKYIDPISESMGSINVVKLYSRKIDDYRYENEFRAIIQMYNQDSYPDHISVPININKFIDEIIFSPFCDKNYIDETRKYLKKVLNIEPKLSKLSISAA